MVNTLTVLSRDLVAELGATASLEANPPWEQDPTTGNWVKRSAAFLLCRDDAAHQLPLLVPWARVLLSQVIAMIKPELPAQHDGPAQACAEDGEPYVEIRADAASYQAAIYEWQIEFRGAIHRRKADWISWRERPGIEYAMDQGELPTWRVYCRFRAGHGAHVACS